MKTITRSLLFLFINFVLVLYVGNVLMDNGATSEWYLNLQKAPWTPDGWVFGFAWTFLMICFAVYLAKLSQMSNSKKLIVLVIVQYILNIIWNYIFFNQQEIILGLIDPKKGNVYIDDKNIDSFKKSWQKQIGYIPQDIYLLDDSIINNIVFSK